MKESFHVQEETGKKQMYLVALIGTDVLNCGVGVMLRSFLGCTPANSRSLSRKGIFQFNLRNSSHPTEYNSDGGNDNQITLIC